MVEMRVRGRRITPFLLLPIWGLSYDPLWLCVPQSLNMQPTLAFTPWPPPSAAPVGMLCHTQPLTIFLSLFFHGRGQCVPPHFCGGQRPPCRSRFSPSTMQALRIKRRSSDLAANTFLCRAFLWSSTSLFPSLLCWFAFSYDAAAPS